MESKEKLRRALEYLDSRTDLTRELVQDMVRRSSLGSGGEEGTSPPPEVVEGVEQSMEAMVISAGGRGVEEPALKRMKGETVEVKEVVDNKDVKKAEESVEDKAEEVEDKVKVEEVVENNNCLPPAVTMDEMELLKKLEEANR